MNKIPNNKRTKQILTQTSQNIVLSDSVNTYRCAGVVTDVTHPLLSLFGKKAIFYIMAFQSFEKSFSQNQFKILRIGNDISFRQGRNK